MKESVSDDDEKIYTRIESHTKNHFNPAESNAG